MEWAIQLFKSNEVTLGRVAELAGLARWEFETLLADRGIARVIHIASVEDLDRQANIRCAQLTARGSRRHKRLGKWGSPKMEGFRC
ncbi:MAG: UPF0175 family protein [Chloroflexi bacterium]|nr:UPF0175 family protein [Chloroflexota bacterium]